MSSQESHGLHRKPASEVSQVPHDKTDISPVRYRIYFLYLLVGIKDTSLKMTGIICDGYFII